jgi:hypothetical protein
MKGAALLEAVLDGDDCSSALLGALKEHLITGQSVDAILGLTAEKRPGARTPRARMLATRRGVSMLKATTAIIQARGCTERQASALLFGYAHADITPPDGIAPYIVEYLTYTDMLGVKVSSVEAMCTALTNYRYSLSKLQDKASISNGHSLLPAATV